MNLITSFNIFAYIFRLCKEMPLTKVTPTKLGFLCYICLLRLPTKDEWSKHLLDCGMADINKRRFECDLCDQAFSKKIVLVRHTKRLHPDREMKGRKTTRARRFHQGRLTWMRNGKKILVNFCLKK